MSRPYHRRRDARALIARVSLVVARAAIAGWLIALWPASIEAQSAGAASAPKLPAYQDRRFDEDWSVLGRADQTYPRDIWNRVKFIPLTESESVWLTFAGQTRGREEYFGQFDFGSSEPAQSEAYFLSRIRLSADLHVGQHFRVFAEAKSSLITDRDLTGGESNGFVDSIDLQNGFADLTLPLGAATVTLRGGRQELLFGAQRLVGPSDWTNVRRTFQGGSGIVQAGEWTVTPFWMELVTVRQHAFNEADPNHKLYGAYASMAPSDAVNADAYWLGADNNGANFNGTSGRERRQTLGGRLFRDSVKGRPDFDVEAAGQFGSVGGNDARAWMASLNGGYTFNARFTPRVFLTTDFASGDRAPGGEVGTFNQLYPTNHAYLGNIDVVGRQNILSPSGGIDLQPVSQLSISVTQYAFWRASRHDALYDSAGAVVRPGTGTSERYIGAETDIVATYRVDRHVLWYAAYNHFFPGAFIRATGPARGINYVYGAVQYTF